LLDLLQGIEQKKPEMIWMGTESRLLASRSARLAINLHSSFVTSQHVLLYFRGNSSAAAAFLRSWEVLKRDGFKSSTQRERKPAAEAVAQYISLLVTQPSTKKARQSSTFSAASLSILRQ
jgi:hypothetical protein